MLIAFYLLKACCTASMLLLDLWCLPAVWRVWRPGRARFYDPMRAAVAWPTTNTLWFQARTWIYGQHLDVMVATEIIWYACAVLFTIAGGHLLYVTVRSYEQADVTR